MLALWGTSAAPAGAIITVAAGVANWRVVDVEITMGPSLPALNALVRVGDPAQRTVDSVATDVVLD